MLASLKKNIALVHNNRAYGGLQGIQDDDIIGKHMDHSQLKKLAEFLEKEPDWGGQLKWGEIVMAPSHMTLERLAYILSRGSSKK